MSVEARLRALGIPTPRRALRRAREAVARLELDLQGIVVATEAGTGIFALTPVIAAAAGARVIAVTRDSNWGSASDVRETVSLAASLAGVDGAMIEVTEDRTDALSRGNLVTNLGFLRPLDRAAIERMQPDAVIALMCEGWEVRPEDIDLGACRERGIVVLGTNEHHASCDVFRYSGPLAGQLLMEAGCELLDARIAVVGRDVFAHVIAAWLERAGAKPHMGISGDAVDAAAFEEADAVLVCDYRRDELMVGSGGLIEPRWLAERAPGALVVQFAGRMHREEILKAGLDCWPPVPVGAHRMVRTFSALGPAPVIDLHAGGLKVGELGVRARRKSANAAEALEAALRASSLVQRVGEE